MLLNTVDEEDGYNDFAFWRRRPVDLNDSSPRSVVDMDEDTGYSDFLYWRRRPANLVGTFNRGSVSASTSRTHC